jgi:DNA polymerase-1
VGIFGPKTAADLIGKYGPLEDLYDLAPEPKTAALKNVLANKETALLSKRLATIAKDAPISFPSAEDFRFNPFPPEKLSEFLLSYGFRNLADRLARS